MFRDWCSECSIFFRIILDVLVLILLLIVKLDHAILIHKAS